jgi:hypothetical protein
MVKYLNIGGQCQSFLFFISQIGVETRTFTYSNFAWVLRCGVDVKFTEGVLDFGAALT